MSYKVEVREPIQRTGSILRFETDEGRDPD